jgi:mRNA interferase RelE/StbE
MTWTIELSKQANKQLSKLDKPVKQRLVDFLKNRVARLDNPRDLGKALQGDLSEYWVYRVGDYRLLASIEDNKLLIVVVEVEHRKQVYK